MKGRRAVLALAMAMAVVLVGCRSVTDSSSMTSVATATPGADAGDMSGAFRVLSDANLLALGTLQLEETDNAVTPDQASKLLPFWTLIQAGTLQGTVETQAVVKQIQATMTEDQMAAIDAMALTQEDFQVWFEAQGVEIPAPGDGQGRAGLGQLSDEERAAVREQFQSMTEDERATAMAEMGIQRPEGASGGQRPGAGGFRGGNAMLTPLIELLTLRAGE